MAPQGGPEENLNACVPALSRNHLSVAQCLLAHELINNLKWITPPPWGFKLLIGKHQKPISFVSEDKDNLILAHNL